MEAVLPLLTDLTKLLWQGTLRHLCTPAWFNWSEMLVILTKVP